MILFVFEKVNMEVTELARAGISGVLAGFLSLGFSSCPGGKPAERLFSALGSAPAGFNRPGSGNRAVLEYRLGEKESRVRISVEDRTWTEVLPAAGRIERSVLGFIKETARPSASRRSLAAAAGRIAGELIPFDRTLTALGVDCLIVIPDGILCRLPFEALRTADGRGFLVERYAISYAPFRFGPSLDRSEEEPGGSCLLAMGASVPDRPAGAGEADAVFEEMPGVREEIRSVSRFFDRNRRFVYLDGAASEATLRRHRGGRYRLVHIAGHGTTEAGDPGRSSLLLCRSAGDDGLLRAEEARALGLAADLVVLSGCRTACGDAPPKEAGGLPRAFLDGGARSVVATLWAVPDGSTADFMKEFYRHLEAGRGKSRALQAAKLGMIHGGRPHPFYWAGYILLGEPEETILFN